jgi:hypothetical protein
MLLHLSKSHYAAELYGCGLLESKFATWLAASPDRILVVRTSTGDLWLVIMEVKTRASPKKIAEAVRIARKYKTAINQCGVLPINQ